MLSRLPALFKSSGLLLGLIPSLWLEAKPPNSPTAQTPPELAEYMGRLQVYTHKLSLSIDAVNTELARFYMFESLALLEEIQETFPEYESIPVALYIDRHGLSAYGPLRELLNAESADTKALSHAMDGIINSCNACHTVSKFEFIKIQRNPHNPYLQDFSR